jgi:hypothetical protein
MGHSLEGWIDISLEDSYPSGFDGVLLQLNLDGVEGGGVAEAILLHGVRAMVAFTAPTRQPFSSPYSVSNIIGGVPLTSSANR